MAGVDRAALERVRELVVGREVFDHDAQFGAVEDLHHLMHALLHAGVEDLFAQEVLDLHGQVAEDHRQCEAFKRPAAG